MVLFLSQLFSEGINYLHDSGLFVLAVHTGIALSCHGLLPIDKEGGEGVLGIAAGGSNSRNAAALSLQRGDEQTEPLTVPSVSAGRLVTLYAQRLQSTDPKVCVCMFYIGDFRFGHT